MHDYALQYYTHHGVTLHTQNPTPPTPSWPAAARYKRQMQQVRVARSLEELDKQREELRSLLAVYGGRD